MDSAQNPISPTPAPENVPTESSGFDSGKKKLLIMIAIAVILLTALVAGIVLLMISRSSPNESEEGKQESLLTSSSNPLAASGKPGEISESDPVAIPSGDSETGGPSSGPAIPEKSLLVALSYTTQPSFSVSIEKAEYVSVPPTIDLIKSDKSAPHSTIRVLNKDGETVYQESFSLTTSAWVEGMDLDPAIEQVATGTEDLVIPVSGTAELQTVEVVTGEGQLLDSYDVSGLEPPEEGAVLGESQGRFVIAVTSESNATGLTPDAYSETLNMVRTISPWSKYKDQIEVKAVPNTTPLGCEVAKGGTGLMYPFCPNQGRVANAVSSAIGHWDAIIVVNNVYCGCGMVAFSGSSFSPVVAVGTPPYPQLIAHELGHAIGHMTDEYMHLHGGISFMGPNCFPSQNSCQQAIAPYQSNRDAQCSAGCNNNGSWRPASLMMYNNLRSGRFGPVERCEMEKKITQVLGIEADCEEDESTASPAPSVSGEPKDFYGWSR